MVIPTGFMLIDLGDNTDHRQCALRKGQEFDQTLQGLFVLVKRPWRVYSADNICSPQPWFVSSRTRARCFHELVVGGVLVRADTNLDGDLVSENSVLSYIRIFINQDRPFIYER